MPALDLDFTDMQGAMPRSVSRDAVAAQAWKDAEAKRAFDAQRMEFMRQDQDHQNLQFKDTQAQNQNTLQTQQIALQDARNQQLQQTLANDATISAPAYKGVQYSDLPEDAKQSYINRYSGVAAQVPAIWNQAQRTVTGDSNIGIPALPEPQRGETIERDSKGGISTKKTFSEPDVQFDPSLTGDVALAGLPSDETSMAKRLANYQISAAMLSRIPADKKIRILNAASAYDPTFDAKEYPARQALQTSFKSGQGAASIRAANTVIAHLGELVEHSKHLDGFGGMATTLNKIRNPILSATGSSKVQAVETAANAISSELAKLYKGTGSATDQEIKEWRHSFKADMSPEQMKAAVVNGVKLMAGAIGSLQNQYEQGFKKPKDKRWLTPEAHAILSKIDGINVDAIDPVPLGAQPSEESTSEPIEAQNVRTESGEAPKANQPDSSGFIVGTTYRNPQGQKAIYIGNGQWKE